MNDLNFFSTSKHEAKDMQSFAELFKSENIKCVRPRYEKFWANDPWMWNGTIEYKRGDLAGQKDFKQEKFEDIIILMKNFIETFKTTNQ
jgi:hypothetical protein